MKKRLMSGLLCTVMAASLALGSVSFAEEERPYWVRDASEVTGKLVVYTTMGEVEQQAVNDIWYKYYPDCEIEWQTDSVGVLITRIRSDETCDADVLGGGLNLGDGDSNHDILQPYTPACNDEQIYTDPSGYYTMLDVQLMCLVVNTELKEELGIEINGYEDLLQPELEGKIILAAPEASSSGWRQVQTILTVMGDEVDDDKSWEYIEKLLPSCYSTNSSKDVYNLVAQGEYVAGLSFEASVRAVIQDGAGVECVYMEEGNTAAVTGAGICKNAQNLPAAQAFMDLLSSAEYQTNRALVACGRGSNSGADLGDLPPQDSINVVEMDLDYLTENKEAIIERWNEVFASIG